MEPTLNAVSLITKKRDGLALTPAEIRALVKAYSADEVPDYQMSAWLMAAVLQGLDDDETWALTDAMLRSGRVLELSSVDRPRVDKHSTGGVGDKVSLTVAPAVAACGVAVPMICGRGLGHTGGTLDKLEAIPGYRTHLDILTFEHVVRTVGVAIMGQTAEIAPADARLYALRDVTGTVESVPLIVASILSKKLAEGIDALVLDVKVGHGAFMKTIDEARTLADALIAGGTRGGKRVTALLTDMSAPIGNTIGNALEIREVLGVLRGGGPEDTVELTLALGAEMLAAARIGDSPEDRMARVRRALDDGSALSVFRRLVEAQGGDPGAVDDPGLLPTAPHRLPVLAETSGVVAGVDALALGLLATHMGAGRARKEDAVNPAVGIELAVRVGAPVEPGQPLAWLHLCNDDAASRWADTLRESVLVTDRVAEPPRSRVLEKRGA